MDGSWEKPLIREERYGRRHPQRDQNPSFSSTLLDAIYRSIDESNGGKGSDELAFHREGMRKKKQYGNERREEEEMASFQRASMVEKWMEKKLGLEKAAVRGRVKPLSDFDKRTRKDNDSVILNSSLNSSLDEYSCGGGFCSSESESIRGMLSSRSSSYTLRRPNPIQTRVSVRPPEIIETERYQNRERNPSQSSNQRPKNGGSTFVKMSKTKALNIYGDLKKVKQPISPGGSLATFLNSLFTAGNAKKVKISRCHERKFTKSEQASTCSSASSFSRSCLSKNPSRGKLNDSNNNHNNVEAIRSVRFFPVSVSTVDEDRRPCGQKNLHERQENLMAITTTRVSTNDELKYHVMNENRRVEEVARNLLKNYHKKKEELDMRLEILCNGINEDSSEEEEEEDDDDDDLASCSSSDLFELDNLAAIGIERYKQELPVYETTLLDTNRAIANGLIM